MRAIDLAARAGALQCFACDSVDGVHVTEPVHAIGASIRELDDYLAGIPLCTDCAAHSHAALRTSRRTLLALPLLPPVVTSAATFLLPLPGWAVVVVYGLGVMAAGVAIRALRRRRARLAPALVLDGQGRTLRLQVLTRGLDADPTRGPYREPGGRGLPPARRPRPPTDGLALYWPAAAICGGALSVWAWFFANPVVVFDNAGGLAATVRIDGGDAQTVSGHARKTLRLHRGSHSVHVQPSFGPGERVDVDVRSGRNFLFAVAPSCYHLSRQSTSRPHRWSNIALQTTMDLTTSGRWVAVGEPDDVIATDCKVPFTGY